MKPFENADKFDKALCVVAACGTAGFSVASVARCGRPGRESTNKKEPQARTPVTSTSLA